MKRGMLTRVAICNDEETVYFLQKSENISVGLAEWLGQVVSV